MNAHMSIVSITNHFYIAFVIIYDIANYCSIIIIHFNKNTTTYAVQYHST